MLNSYTSKICSYIVMVILGPQKWMLHLFPCVIINRPCFSFLGRRQAFLYGGETGLHLSFYYIALLEAVTGLDLVRTHQLLWQATSFAMAKGQGWPGYVPFLICPGLSHCMSLLINQPHLPVLLDHLWESAVSPRRPTPSERKAQTRFPTEE